MDRPLLRKEDLHDGRPILKSAKLADVCYDIRGPVLARARQMEEEGHRIIKLNIGNPAAFGFEAPEEILQDVIHNLPAASGYCDSKGLFAARKAVMHVHPAEARSATSRWRTSTSATVCPS